MKLSDHKTELEGLRLGPKFVLRSAETKVDIAQKCWHFNIYKHDKLQALVI